MSPAWSADGKWLYFLSDRSLKTTVVSPWGARQPEPHFDRPVKIYELALVSGLRSPFPACPTNCIRTAPPKSDDKAESKAADGKAPDAKSAGAATSSCGGRSVVSGSRASKEVRIDFADLQSRLSEVPVRVRATTTTCKSPTSGCAGRTPATRRLANLR